MPETFVHQFCRQMTASPDHVALVCIAEDGAERPVSRREFFGLGQSQAQLMQSEGIAQDDLVLLALPHGLDLFSAFWGALLLGAIPVVHPYQRMLESNDDYVEQLTIFASRIEASAVLIGVELSQSDARFIANKKSNASDSKPDLTPPIVDSLEQTALIQFSSGTTGAKKGVLISHRAMLNYLEAFVITMKTSPDDTIVSWLPLQHDMGLIGCFIMPLVGGFPTVIMSPQYWIGNPGSLFKAIDQHRGTIVMMPGFAFSYCTKTIPGHELPGLDLSCLRMLISGAEPVRKEVLDNFSSRFRSYGLNPQAVCVGYGMAECVLGVSRTPIGTSPRVDRTKAREVMSCGRPHPMVKVEIVSETGEPLPDREVGEIRIKSTTLFSGYYLQPELSEESLVDGWFKTGDLGYLHDGELYVCGRKKDLIISFGNNIYPGDIEEIAESFSSVRNGRVVAFGVNDEQRDTEKVVLLCELAEVLPTDRQQQLATDIRDSVWQQLDVMVPVIDFVEKGWIIKTTSGKLSRSANRDKYLQKINSMADSP